MRAVTCVSAKTKTRSKKSSSGATRFSESNYFVSSAAISSNTAT